jgi:TetR/AcrR family transcriptional regulator, cholesterol catabolism regulator
MRPSQYISISPKKKVIVDAAAELFRDKGYNAASMRDIAQKVGIEASSIYSHIKSKEELLAHICMNCAYGFIAGMDAIFNNEGLTPKEKMVDLIHLHIDMAYDFPASIAVFNDEWRYLPGEAMVEFKSLRKAYETKFNQVLADGKSVGLFHFAKQDIIYNVIIKTITWSYGAQKNHSRTAVKAELTTFIIQALQP